MFRPSSDQDSVCEVSIVVPVFNESESIPRLVREIDDAMTPTGKSWELVFVDDGSTDDSFARLQLVAAENPRVRAVSLRRNFGQTAAMQAGIDYSCGRLIVTLDGDLQNDPRDIPDMLQLIERGADLVLGWRRNRQDPWFSRRLPSWLANRLISWTTGVNVRDLGCTLKAMRADLARELELLGEMHRFIPVLCHQVGARVEEMETRHRPRQFGRSKYGLRRTSRVLLDLLTANFLLRYSASPMKYFGKQGLLVAGCSVFSILAALTMKLWRGTDLTGNPMLMLGAVGTILSCQLFGLGLLGEVNSRIYYSAGSKQNFHVRELVNFGPAEKGTLPLSLRRAS